MQFTNARLILPDEMYRGSLAVRNGPVALTPIPNGPLQARGPLEVVSGTGRTINKVEETYLCRCGASKNKPYCDGSHKAIGFTAP